LIAPAGSGDVFEAIHAELVLALPWHVQRAASWARDRVVMNGDSRRAQHAHLSSG
jgi:hypothetical protein